MPTPQNGYLQLNLANTNPPFGSNLVLLPFVGSVAPSGITAAYATANWGAFQMNVAAPQAISVLVQQAAFLRDAQTQSITTHGWIVARRRR